MKPYYALLGILLTACQDNQADESESFGFLSLNIDISNNMESSDITRSVNDDTYRIDILNKAGVVRRYRSLSEMPAEIQLSSDNYTAQIAAGDSLPGGFDTPYYIGTKDFTVSTGQSTQVDVVCKIANTPVKTVFAENLSDYFKSYQVTVASNDTSLVYTNGSSKGYFMLSGKNRQLTWTFEGTKNNGSTHSANGKFTTAAGTEYTLTFAGGIPEATDGGAAVVQITVDETTPDITDEIVIMQKPKINFDGSNNTTLYVETGSVPTQTVWVNATAAIAAATVESGLFPSTSAYDLLNLPNAITDAGFSSRYGYDAATDRSTLRFDIAAETLSALPDGDYPLTFHVTDANGLASSKTLTLSVSAAVITTTDLDTCTVWAHRALLTGKLLRATTDTPQFRYRPIGSNTWTTVDAATDADNNLSASLANLTANTTYEYQALAGENIATLTCTFTTEAAAQLPNSGFEQWSGSSPLLIYGNGESMFWDSGNHGSATLNKNVTNYDESTFVEGKRSAKLSSQFVGIIAPIGAFAAGNLFAGEFVGIENTSQGILDFGRPWSTRPTKLTGAYKYTSKTVDYSSTNVCPKGVADSAHIYIAIGDWDSPIRIRTSIPQLFSKDDEHIIAYGELIQGNTVSNWTDFEIELKYRSEIRKPTYIVVVSSASKYGDYFTGGAGSTLWLDNFNLEY